MASAKAVQARYEQKQLQGQRSPVRDVSYYRYYHVGTNSNKICRPTNLKAIFKQPINYLQYVDDNMVLDDTFVKEHIHRWTKVWNDHNIKKVISLYSENILFSSPKVRLV